MLSSDKQAAESQHIKHKWLKQGHTKQNKHICTHCGLKKYSKRSNLGFPVTYYDTGNEILTLAPSCKRHSTKAVQLAFSCI